MATSSRVAAVKAAVIALLQADTDLADSVQITYSTPSRQVREQIYFYSATVRHDYPVVRSGRQVRDELVDLRLAIQACLPGQAGQAAETRALAMFAVVEDAIADNATLSDTVTSIECVGFESGVDPNGEGWDGLIVATLRYSARLT